LLPGSIAELDNVNAELFKLEAWIARQWNAGL